MEAVRRVPKTELARNTKQVINSVLRGQTALIEDHGEPEAAIIDITDYYILRSAMRYYVHPREIDAESAAGLSDAEVDAAGGLQERYNMVIGHYLAGAISLGRMAELLGLPMADLQMRFVRLDVPLRLGPQTMEEARMEVENARRWAAES